MQVSNKLRRQVGAYLHWCPACKELHPLPDSWTFNGDLENPTFTPSFKHSAGARWVCHYILTNGVLSYCADCTHEFAGRVVELPELPTECRDEGFNEEVIDMAKKNNGNSSTPLRSDMSLGTLHNRVSAQLVDGYDDVFIPAKGDDAPIGARHDPFGQGRIQYEKVQVKSSKGDLIGAWKLVYVAPDAKVISEEVEEVGEVGEAGEVS